MRQTTFTPSKPIRRALDTLGIRNLLLGVHDPAFPSRPEEDIGRGSPYSAGAADLLRFVHDLGFTGLQLGPQGWTSSSNPSPYDGALFSRNPLSVSFPALTQPEWGALLGGDAVADAVARRPGPVDRVAYEYACGVSERLLTAAWTALRIGLAAGDPVVASLAQEMAAFRQANRAWLERDALYEALRREHDGRHWRDWMADDGRPHPDQRLWDGPSTEQTQGRREHLLRHHAHSVDAYAFVQFLVHAQHARFQEQARELGLALFGDLQIGFSERDEWFAQPFVLRDYVMGAPPSRTNPEGQPWGYPILDPTQYFAATAAGMPVEGPALHFLRKRVEKMFVEFDGLRIDHPHGLICPWVYRARTSDPLRAVQGGARLFASPDLPDHPGLARYAHVRPEQLNRAVARHADDWVAELEPEQVERYGSLFWAILEAAQHHGRRTHQIVCEILSTQPYPVQRVMAQCGLGRFRVTQKADLERSDDVYRSENARPEDWIMLGNHDTQPIWQVAEGWMTSGRSVEQARYLATRLVPDTEDRDAWARWVGQDLGDLVQAMLADLFVGPACNVMVYFTDLLGLREPYNRPGITSAENWSLRIGPSFRQDYTARLAANRALNLPRALARALRARGRSYAETHRALIDELECLATMPCAWEPQWSHRAP